MAGTPGLPQVLAPSDASRLRRIFQLQAAGDLAAAEQEATRLADRRLMGHVLADRWERPGVEPSAEALRRWLALHADQPEAQAIHDRLARMLPPGGEAPPALPPGTETLSPDAVLAPEERDTAPPGAGFARNAALERAVRDRALDGKTQQALAQISRTRGVTPAYRAELLAELGTGLFRAGRDEEAFRVAAEAARAAPGNARAAFAAGLAAWGLERYEASAAFFENAARTEGAAAALRSAAAFWTARAAVRARQPTRFVPWMTQAAQEPRTFYGLVARRSLGLATDFAWERELVGVAEAAAVAETAGGWRALALLQLGQTARAEAELRQLWGKARSNAGLTRAMLAVATQAGMTRLSSQLAAASQGADGRPRDFARFPLPPLRPQGGFRVDPSLLYALALQESRFDPRAVSSAGARGLMQIMPATASFVAGDSSAAGRLHDPGFALEIGQRYLHHLARLDVTDGGNLIRVLAAYNAGPGNLSRWLPASGHRDDPFLFIEAIPFDETRDFVRRVLAYSWIYASRLGLPAPSLDELAAGSFPKFAGPEAVTAMLRRGPRALH
jgi:soluble lytic murein transglycosylase-like protein